MATDNDQSSDPTATIGPGQAREAVRILIEAFDTLTNAGAVRVQTGGAELFRSVFGWWAWINNSAKLVLLAHDNGRGHEAAPSVRSILEHAVVMQWVIDDPDAATEAVAAKADEDRRKLLDEIQALKWTIPADVTRPDRTRQTMLDFASLCTRYGAKAFYAPYRMLSAHVHPSAKGAEAYLDPDTLQLRNYADRPAGPDLVLITICMIQSAQVIDAFLADQPLATAIAETNAVFGNSINPIKRP